MLRKAIESIVVLAGLMACPAFSSQNSEPNLLRIDRAMLCVTEGSVDETPYISFP